MNEQEEIKEIFGHLRNILAAHRDVGLEPPHISAEDLAFLDAGAFTAHRDSAPLNDQDSLEALMAYMGDCGQCKLHTGRTRLVFGEGSPRASLVFIGEGPGRDEDLAGKPFVGEAGKLLTRIIENGMGLARKDVYICNIVKCRPPKNRDPEGDEIESCMPFLRQQLRIIKPAVICALGRVAGQAMLGGNFKISRERGKWLSYMGIPLMATYHPAYLCDAAIVRDIGILASKDPVAIDQASVDLVNRVPAADDCCIKESRMPGDDKFRDIYPNIDWGIQLEHAEKIGLGTRKYELVPIHK